MRWLWAAFVVLACMCAPVRAEPFGPGPFTKQFARSLQAALPSTSVAVVRELQLNVRRKDGSSATINLDNAFRDYSTDPKGLDQIVKNFAAAIGEHARPQPAKLDRNNIVPLIKDRGWLAQLQQAYKKTPQEPLYDDFNNELVVVYAEDTEARTRYLSTSESIGVARNELRALALKNLMRIMPKIEMRQHDDAFAMITSHADYGASLLLVDEMWTRGQIKVHGDIVVAVPAKDVILVTGSRNRKGLIAIRSIAPKLAQGRYGLIDTLFVYRKGRFVRFGRN